MMTSILAFGESPSHILLLLLLVLLLFGGKKLPELARGLGEAMKEFKKAQRDLHDDVAQVKPVDQTPPPAAKNDQQKPA